MSEANSRQVAGKHYQLEYQPWDWFTDANMPYLQACACKYIIRWREKNGVEDLEKARHYIQKAIEKETKMVARFKNAALAVKFISQLTFEREQNILFLIAMNCLDSAELQLGFLIAEEK